MYAQCKHTIKNIKKTSKKDRQTPVDRVEGGVMKKQDQPKFTRKCAGVYIYGTWTVRKAGMDYVGHPYEGKWIAEDDEAEWNTEPTTSDTLREMKALLGAC